MSGSNPGAGLEEVTAVRLFEGWLRTFEHDSDTCRCRMRFSVYLPPAAEAAPVPLVTWLSGLTCTDENFMTKAGAQRVAAELGVALLAPDTSPRGDHVPDDEAYDLGQGAGFYLDATDEPWSEHFRMESYLTGELPTALHSSDLPLDLERQAVSGHSMGGHGALVLALRHPGVWRSVSAFAPICSPTRCPWGEKAFSAYLGDDRSAWQGHDACLLLETAEDVPPLKVDQGTADGFLEEQLHPHLLRDVCERRDHELSLEMREHYDHSYHFIATFIEDHLRFHAQSLGV